MDVQSSLYAAVNQGIIDGYGPHEDSCAANIASLAAWERRVANCRNIEMSGLVTMRKEFGGQKPLKGIHISGRPDTTPAAAALLSALAELGAEVQQPSFAPPDIATAAVAVNGARALVQNQVDPAVRARRVSENSGQIFIALQWASSLLTGRMQNDNFHLPEEKIFFPSLGEMKGGRVRRCIEQIPGSFIDVGDCNLVAEGIGNSPIEVNISQPASPQRDLYQFAFQLAWALSGHFTSEAYQPTRTNGKVHTRVNGARAPIGVRVG